MRAYIDTANLVSFLRSKRINPDMFEDCLKLLYRKLDLYLDMTEKEFKSNQELGILARKMYQNERKPKFGNWHLSARPFKKTDDFENCLVERDHHSAVYLLKDELAAKIGEKGNYHITNKGNELNILSKLFAIEEQFSKHLDITEPATFDLHKWGPIEMYARPCSDIIVADSYILTRENRIQKNLARFLLTLCKRLNNASSVNIVIFCFDKTENRDEDGTSTPMTPDFEKARKIIKDLLDKHNILSNISFISVKKEILKEHDRTVFTNYMWYIPGASLNFFDQNDKLITNGRHFHIDSLAEPKNYESAFRFIDKLQGIINNIKKNPDEGAFHLEKNTKKMSNYLTL